MTNAFTREEEDIEKNKIKHLGHLDTDSETFPVRVNSTSVIVQIFRMIADRSRDCCYFYIYDQKAKLVVKIIKVIVVKI